MGLEVKINNLNKIKRVISSPDLLEIQKDSFDWFVEKGIRSLLDEFRESEDQVQTSKAVVDFVDYEIEKPTSNPVECKEKGRTYAGKLRLKVRITFVDTGEMKEQMIMVGEFPYMTPTGSFIINGVERVVVAQLTRSPGVYFESENLNRFGKTIYKATVIPDRGSWLEFETDVDGTVYVHLDKRSKKILVSVLLKAYGLSEEQIREAFIRDTIVSLDPKSEDFLRATGKVLAETIYDYETGEDLIVRGTALSTKDIALISKLSLTKVKIIDKGLPENVKLTLEKDDIKTMEDARKLIFVKLRPGERYTSENADIQFKMVLTDSKRNDLGEVGRYKMNKKLGLNSTSRTVTWEDIVQIVQYFTKIEQQEGSQDNRDHLGNKRVRLVGELLKNSMRIGLLRVTKNMHERISITPEEEISVQSVINPRPLLASINEFFSLGQLSQFMEETNPLASLTHKRRISSLGPGGLHRERAGAEVRDVHHSHYGRICPIETPEGENVGLINSLTVYARINQQGFIVTPYIKVVKSKLTGEIVELTADDEEIYHIAQANTPVDDEGNITSDTCVVLFHGDVLEVPKEKVQFIDVSPLQVFSASASLIPFLEHDDANRALMGCNMQHQAVPLIQPEIAYAGTGMEQQVAVDSGAAMTISEDGVVGYVDSCKMVVSSPTYGTETVKIGSFNKNVKNDYLGQAIPNIAQVGELITGVMMNELFKAGIKKINHTKQEDLEIIELAELVVHDKNESLIDKELAEKVVLPNGKVLAESGKKITETLLNRFFTAKIPDVAVLQADQSIAHESVSITRIIRKENLPQDRLLLDTKPYYDDLPYGQLITPYTMQLINSKTLQSITLIKPEKLKSSEIFILNKKLLHPVSLANDISVEGKSIAKKGEAVTQELLASLLENGIDEVMIGKEKEFQIDKFKRTNQDTVMNKRPIVRAGEIVKKNQVIMDGGSCDRGRLALGRNLLVAYIPWRGYNYQDAIVLSERIVENDVLTSLHITEYKVLVRDTKVGPEEVTRDIPNVPEEQLRNLDENGIIRIGTEVGPNDILVGKITPKAESEFTPEMKLWRAMFDKKGQDVKDSSLRVEPGERGTVIGVQVLSREDEENLPIGVNKTVKVYIGQKRKIQVGDKLSGRHGNKGVISRILPVQDMPFLEDGTPVDIVLNSLGVPSRMNVGQIMECLLGSIASHESAYAVNPPFSGITPEELMQKLEEHKIYSFGKRKLFDGYTGEPFYNDITVGYAYIMKLNHMVEDKIHARSTGPYALITQQPLGGKAQFGGQRFGEMEVWALEAYGAAYTLQEMLTVKSDDTDGRLVAYEAICTRKLIPSSNNPESFRVIINELKGLGIKLETDQEQYTAMEESLDLNPFKENTPEVVNEDL